MSRSKLHAEVSNKYLWNTRQSNAELIYSPWSLTTLRLESALPQGKQSPMSSGGLHKE
jgi:hypothetical protein